MILAIFGVPFLSLLALALLVYLFWPNPVKQIEAPTTEDWDENSYS